MSVSVFSQEFLCIYNDMCETDSFNENLRNLWSCDWKSVLQYPGFDVFQPYLKKDPLQYAEDLLSSTIASLLIFMQANFTGPDLNEELTTLIKSNEPGKTCPQKELAVDGEELNANVKYPEMLLAAKRALDLLLTDCSKSLVLNWWKLRLLSVHQQVLDGLAQSIYSELTTVVGNLFAIIEECDTIETKALLHLEIGFAFLLFHRTQKCEDQLAKACDLLEISLNVEGLLGLRTQFQQKALPQLCLKVKQNAPDRIHAASKTHGNIVLPKLLNLDDDALLERIKFVSVEDNETMALPSIVQGVVLLKLNLLLRSQPKDRLADEELEPYINTLLYQEHGPLTVRLSTLLINIRQQKDNKRTVERSLKQCEEVLKITDNCQFSVADRLSYGFATILLPRWKVQKMLGELMVSLGLIKNALDLYLDIQEWEEVVMCYTRLDLRHKAAEIISQQIKTKPSAKLYCLLGDATDDVTCYEKAWEFSKETSGVAQSYWGSYYFAKKDYENALPHLQKSLEINSLQETMWLRLGYSAIMLEKWELAVHAYLTYTHIEPYGFESWSNLATALIKLRDYKRAHKILGEALKCNYNNWKVWENYMLVSVQTGNFEDAINAYSRLIELKEKFIDLEIIEIIANAIAKDVPDAQGRPTQRLGKKCATLLAHQCVQYGSEYKLWELAALVAQNPDTRTEKLQKGYAMYTQKNTSWVKSKDTCSRAMDLCRQLCESSLETFGETETEKIPASELSLFSSVRLSVQACVRAVENHPEKWDELQGDLENLKSFLQKITDKLKKGT